MLSEARLLVDLEAISEQQSPLELCILAFKYIQKDTVREVHSKHRNKGPRAAGSAWFDICHIIGRLASWAKAVKVLVCYVREQPSVLENFRIGFIEAPSRTKRLMTPPPEDNKTHLKAVIEGMLPNDKGRAEQVMKLLKDSIGPDRLDIDKEFAERYNNKNFTPRCHTEVLLLEHFWTEKISFFKDDSYVGISKPPCYSCHLFFKFHSSRMVTRPTRGNAWSKWCVPPGCIQDEERFEYGTKLILHRMAETMRLDLLNLIETDLPRLARPKDSTTGIWTAPTLRTLSVPIV
jgi:OTT_1508-like deaminase